MPYYNISKEHLIFLITFLKDIEDREFLTTLDNMLQTREIDETIIPETLMWKIIDNRESEEMTQEDVESIKKAYSDNEWIEL